jgi:hypothetical protein
MLRDEVERGIKLESQDANITPEQVARIATEITSRAIVVVAGHHALAAGRKGDAVVVFDVFKSAKVAASAIGGSASPVPGSVGVPAVLCALGHWAAYKRLGSGSRRSALRSSGFY